ncbi:MAG: potassium channel protein [candidate division Zixibacteria bacterium]|nr:potassium channel protein [candidate division Zixibacteria bacterium]
MTGFRKIIGMIIGVAVFGTAGFQLVEGWGFLDSFYMTITTLSMVGYGEVHPLSNNGKIFASVLMIFGVATVAYTIGSLVQFVLEGQLRKVMGKIMMEKQIKKFKKHYIICGYGRVGRQVCNEFVARNVPFVVIENDPDSLEYLSKTTHVHIEGNAIEDEVLKSAGIEKATGMVSTIASEADNVYLALSARYLNPELTITCRADSEEAEKKIQRAGANRVISPYVIGGVRMALATLRPNVVDFLQLTASGPKGNFRIEELYIKENSPIANRMLKDTDIRAKLGITIVGIRKPNKTMIKNPSAETVIDAGDIIILLGDDLQLEKLEEMTVV